MKSMNSKNGLTLLLLGQWSLYALFTFWPLVKNGITGTTFFEVSSRGIGLFLLSFITAYVLYCLNRTNSPSRWITALIFFLSWSLLAIPFNKNMGYSVSRHQDTHLPRSISPYSKCAHTQGIKAFIACMKQATDRPEFTIQNPDSTYCLLRFTSFKPRFKSLLEQAARGEIRLRIKLWPLISQGEWANPDTAPTPRIFVEGPEVTRTAITPSNPKLGFIEIPAQHIQTFLHSKTLFIYPGEYKSITLQQRDGERPKNAYRTDSIHIDGTEYPINGDGLLFVSFEFESLDHRPIAVFY